MHEIVEATQRKPRRRWPLLLAITVFAQVLSCAWFPSLTCGGCFHPEAFFVSVVPLLWSLYLLIRYRGPVERVLSWGAFGISVWWLWFTLGQNGNPILYLVMPGG